MQINKFCYGNFESSHPKAFLNHSKKFSENASKILSAVSVKLWSTLIDVCVGIFQNFFSF